MSAVGWTKTCNFCGQSYEANLPTDAHDPCEGWPEPVSATTLADVYAYVDEQVSAYQNEAVSPERALSNIAAIIADYETTELMKERGEVWDGEV
jgi:hypothetical protein